MPTGSPASVLRADDLSASIVVMRGFVPLAVLGSLSTACFSPDPLVTSGTTDTDAGTFGSTSNADVTASDSLSTQSATVDAASNTSPTSVTTGETDPTVDPDSSTGAAELGPRIIMSVPMDGDANAPLSGYFLLYFDRVVSTNDAVGHILVSQNGSAPQPISPMPCPPDADPTCIAGVFPAAFLVPDTNQLPGGTTHTITVEADFPDPDGMVNTLDQVVEFTTFDYDPDFFDDSDAVVQEFGGIAYDEGSQSLFITGVPSNFGDPCVVRRIPIPGGVAGAASTAASPTSSYLCYGIDAIEGSLFVSGSYSSNVFRYTNLANMDLQPSQTIIASPTLTPPLDNLDEVWSVARGGGATYFSHGEFFGGTEDTSILALSDANAWSEFESGENLWDNASGVVIEGAAFDGIDHLMVGANDTVYKFRIADGNIISQFDLNLGYDADLHVDSQGRLWVGTGSGLHVYDAADDSYTELASRPGLDTTRFAIREDGDTVHVYYARFRDVGLIGHLSIDF